MATELRGYCEECERYVLARKPSFNHMLHLLLTLVICGLWLPLWLLLFVLHNPSARCPRCGSQVAIRYKRDKGVLIAGGIFLIILTGAIIAVALAASRSSRSFSTRYSSQNDIKPTSSEANEDKFRIRNVHRLPLESMEVGMMGPFDESIVDFRVEEIVIPHFDVGFDDDRRPPVTLALVSLSAKNSITGKRGFFLLACPSGVHVPGHFGDHLAGVFLVHQKGRRAADGNTCFTIVEQPPGSVIPLIIKEFLGHRRF